MATSPPRSNLIEVANKLLNPYMLNDWVAEAQGTVFDQRIDAFYGGEDALEKANRHIANNFTALEYIKAAGAIDFTATRNKDDKPFPWQVLITKVDRDSFFALLETESLQLVGDKIVEQLAITLFPLAAVKQRVGSDFVIHTNGTVSYRGTPIKLQGSQAKVAIALMAASTTSSKYISLGALQTLTKSDRIPKIINELRPAFQNATQNPQHRFFFNDRMLGYSFSAK